MDGGGFSNTTQPQRAKGVTPVSGDIINRSTGQADSLIIPFTSMGDKKLGKVVKYVGVFRKLEEEALTHYTAVIDDSTSDIPVKCIIQSKENNKGSRIDFDRSIADSYTNHHVAVLGYINSHIDHGRVLNVLDISLVKTPWQFLCHHLEVSLQLKMWKEQGNSSAAGANGVGASGAMSSMLKHEQDKNATNKNLTAQVLKIINEQGEANSWGCHRDTVHKVLEGSGISKSKIDQVIGELVDEGTVYNTLDDDNFKSSDQQ